MVKDLWENPEQREQLIEMQRNLWADPEYKDRQVKAMREGAKARPTKPEVSAINILDGLYPNEWKYVGDGAIIIEGRNPDIININGKKAIVEVFGDYWHGFKHTRECPLIHELDRIDTYTKYGYKTLILWEHELKDEGSTVKKIKEFCAIIGLHNEV
jgi:G:T-mismatch repair DNA endonuclease (very short patch repair protein)